MYVCVCICIDVCMFACMHACVCVCVCVCVCLDVVHYEQTNIYRNKRTNWRTIKCVHLEINLLNRIHKWDEFNESMNERTNERMNVSMNRYINKCLNEYTNEWMHELINYPTCTTFHLCDTCAVAWETVEHSAPIIMIFVGGLYRCWNIRSRPSPGSHWNARNSMSTQERTHSTHYFTTSSDILLRSRIVNWK